MKVLKKGATSEGTAIQIEEWNENYNFMLYGSTIASYPISKVSHPESFAPQRGEKYRFSFDFKSYEEAEEIFNNLIDGTIQLSDLKENYSGKREYLDCF